MPDCSSSAALITNLWQNACVHPNLVNTIKTSGPIKQFYEVKRQLYGFCTTAPKRMWLLALVLAREVKEKREWAQDRFQSHAVCGGEWGCLWQKGLDMSTQTKIFNVTGALILFTVSWRSLIHCLHTVHLGSMPGGAGGHCLPFTSAVRGTLTETNIHLAIWRVSFAAAFSPPFPYSSILIRLVKMAPISWSI